MRTPAIFEAAASPRSRSGNRIRTAASWWTWSRAFREELPGWLESARDARCRPRTARIPGLKGYDYTFSALHGEAGRSLARKLLPWAASLQRVNPGNQIMLLRDLLVPGMNSDDMRLLFTGLRDALTPNTHDTDCALYAPLGHTGGAPSEFPLHCDLYVPVRLWNVFDEVPAAGRGGSSIFLRTSEMMVLAAQCGVPQTTRLQLKDCLKSYGHDRYDEFYGLLYNDTPSSRELDRRMRSASHRIRLNRGEGYLIHDRVWMHGRTMTENTVTRNRLHRLTF
jgi:hypothetical protein